MSARSSLAADETGERDWQVVAAWLYRRGVGRLRRAVARLAAEGRPITAVELCSRDWPLPRRTRPQLAARQRRRPHHRAQAVQLSWSENGSVLMRQGDRCEPGNQAPAGPNQVTCEGWFCACVEVVGAEVMVGSL